MQSEPTFNPLVNGISYPILHVYEDFGTIDLVIAASDIDKFSNMSAQVISSEDGIGVNVVNESNYITPTGISFGEIFNWESYIYPFTQT
jgi:hypothetical protein